MLLPILNLLIFIGLFRLTAKYSPITHIDWKLPVISRNRPYKGRCCSFWLGFRRRTVSESVVEVATKNMNSGRKLHFWILVFLFVFSIEEAIDGEYAKETPNHS